MTPLTKLLLLLSTLTLLSCTEHPQQADPDFKPKNSRVSFSGDSRPLVLVDAAHHNFLTIEGRYRPFAQVLLSDGYRVEANERRFSLAELSRGDILVVANALDRDRVDWQPPFGAALDEDEVASVKQWVSGGGSLITRLFPKW